MDKLQTTLLSVKLNWLENDTVKRRKIAQAYWKLINNPEIKLLDKLVYQENYVHHLFVTLSHKEMN